MSGQAARTHAPDPPQKGAKPKRWKVVVNTSGAEKDAAQPGEQDHISADRLREAARHPRPLPYRTELETQFGADLSGISLADGPEVTETLKAQGAEAAVIGDTILARPGAERPVIAHEVAHVLQQRAAGVTPPGPDAETEALDAEAHVAANRPVPPVETSIATDALAYRRPDAEFEAEIVVAEPQEAAAEFEQGRDEPVPEEEVGGETQAPEAESEREAAEEGEAAVPAEAEEGAPGEGADLGEDVAEEATPTFEPAPMPELEVDTEAAEEKKEEAEAALEGAEDADGLMTTFKDAPPSVKAMRHDTLEETTGELAAEDQAEFENDMPEFTAEMSGTDDLAETVEALSEEVDVAEARIARLSPAMQGWLQGELQRWAAQFGRRRSTAGREETAEDGLPGVPGVGRGGRGW